jgi:hypothetical protein
MSNEKELKSFVLWILLIVFVIMISCKKETGGLKLESCDVYELRIDYYSLDTVPLVMKIGAAKGRSSFTWYKDTICDYVYPGRTIHYESKETMESAPDIWAKMCPQAGQEFYWIEHLYYLKNGKKIQPSKYPKK